MIFLTKKEMPHNVKTKAKEGGEAEYNGEKEGKAE